ncbi:MAG: iron ABC transporter permease [Caldilineaceae bacterium SB0664_bin_27]|uniref:Iron ABC transporter permease n=1 Tax=Caldilineaceae bacterium SB0664_bin_27 TaxID=2605260 RepID=A0A6B0YXS8_9CHLR|nr:iron ABC transporter permease [Caldilineaceae bacterium SB0664_bin_27]
MNRGNIPIATPGIRVHPSLTRGFAVAPGLLLAGLGLVAIAAFMLSLAVGSVRIPLDEIVSVLLGGDASKQAWATIVLKFRLPKALTAMLAGAALSVSGLQMQTLFRNPLAGPFVLGISSGASLGVALTVLLAGVAVGLGGSTTLLAGISLAGDTSLALSAIAGSGLVLLLVMSVARKVQSGMTLLILGLMFGYTTSALVSVLIYFSVVERIQAYISWTFGSFGGVTWRQLQVMAPAILVGLAGGHLLMKPLNALLLGETYALSLGLNVRRVRLGIIGTSAVLAGVVTAFCGPIGFLGIAVPHLCRSLLHTSDHRLLLPAVTFMGATLALGADIVAGLPGSQLTLPLNAVTALLGAPVVIWVILRQRNLRQAFAG